MHFQKQLKHFFIIILSLVILASCKNAGDARKIPPNVKDRVQQNIEEGRGFRLMGNIGTKKSGEFDFASSNELWRASLDTLDFMPLALANYSGGIIVTDWYSDASSGNDSIKITVRFLSNEVQSNSIKIIVHNKKCKINENCTIKEIDSKIKFELQKTILAKAVLIEQNSKTSKKK